MNKNLLLVSLLAGCAVSAYAEYTTLGDGTVYSLESLSQIEGSGVAKAGSVYTLTDDVTVAVGDAFNVDAGATIKMATGVTLRIEGTANFDVPADKRVLITRADETAEPKGIYVQPVVEGTAFKNIDFEYAALRSYGEVGMVVDNCTFRYANGKMNGTGALALGVSGACFTVTNCTFEYNTVPAIGGGANITCGLTVDNCTFVDNNTSNTNKPQINVTVGGDDEVKIINSTITGAERTKVGGIAVGNMLQAPGTNNVLIENCTITKNRYGITGVGPMSLVIRDNTLVDNRYDTNPMNGGSALSLSTLTNSIVSGNYIESHLWGITLINVASANLGEVGNADSPGNNVFKDNGNYGSVYDPAHPYDLYNNSTATVYAQNNIWSVDEQTEELIETVIFHQNDNSKLGQVIFMPAGDPASIEGVADDAVKPYVANGTLFVPAAMSGSVEVYTIDGKMVDRLAITDGTADLLDLAPGNVYVLRVVSSDYNAALKYRN